MTAKETEASDKKLLLIGQASRRTGLPANTVRALCERRQILAYLVLDKWRIDQGSLDRYMAKHANIEGA